MQPLDEHEDGHYDNQQALIVVRKGAMAFILDVLTILY